MRKATRKPISSAPSKTRMPPTTTTSPIDTTVSVSTTGINEAERKEARTVRSRWVWFSVLKLLRFLSCRFVLCVTRTPDTFSCRLPFTAEIAIRTPRNVGRDFFCQKMRMTASTGMTASVTMPSSGSR